MFLQEVDDVKVIDDGKNSQTDVKVCVCTHVCGHVYAFFTCVCAHRYVCMFVSACMFFCVCLCVHTCVDMGDLCVHVCVYMSKCMCTL